MTVQSIVKMGNQKLNTPSRPVTDFSDASLIKIVEDMHDTMKELGGVGIAAPQIGHNLRVMMFGFETNARYPQEQSVPFSILINPEIQILSDEMIDGWEGCLSVPGLRGLVPRYKSIRYQGYDLHGELIVRRAENFHARMVQHEYDHLDGILFPRRIKDLAHFGFEDELKNIIWPE